MKEYNFEKFEWDEDIQALCTSAKKVLLEAVSAGLLFEPTEENRNKFEEFLKADEEREILGTVFTDAVMCSLTVDVLCRKYGREGKESFLFDIGMNTYNCMNKIDCSYGSSLSFMDTMRIDCRVDDFNKRCLEKIASIDPADRFLVHEAVRVILSFHYTDANGIDVLFYFGRYIQDPKACI